MVRVRVRVRVRARARARIEAILSFGAQRRVAYAFKYCQAKND